MKNVGVTLIHKIELSCFLGRIENRLKTLFNKV